MPVYSRGPKIRYLFFFLLFCRRIWNWHALQVDTNYVFPQCTQGNILLKETQLTCLACKITNVSLTRSTDKYTGSTRKSHKLLFGPDLWILNGCECHAHVAVLISALTLFVLLSNNTSRISMLDCCVCLQKQLYLLAVCCLWEYVSMSFVRVCVRVWLYLHVSVVFVLQQHRNQPSCIAAFACRIDLCHLGIAIGHRRFLVKK